MKNIILFLVFTLTCNHAFCQYKIVKLNIDSTKQYLRYYYKSKYHSDEVLNDSVTILCRKITDSSFYLDKIVNKRKVWTRVYNIQPAKDSLGITTLARTKKGGHKFIYTKEKYYNSFTQK